MLNRLRLDFPSPSQEEDCGDGIVAPTIQVNVVVHVVYWIGRAP
jgi:hypothetical protein